MKVVAIVEQGSYGKYLIEANVTELHHITGKHGYERFVVGDQIDVSALFNRINRLHENKENVEKCQKQLRALADLLESFDPVVRKVFEQEIESEVERVGD